MNQQATITGNGTLLGITAAVLTMTWFLLHPVALVAGLILGHCVRARNRVTPSYGGAPASLFGLIVGYAWVAFLVFAILAPLLSSALGTPEITTFVTTFY